MKETFSYIAIAAIFLAGIVPVVTGIVQAIKENRKLNEAQSAKKARQRTA